MIDYIDYEKAERELINFIRNSDVFSTTLRSVTTITDTGTLDSDDEYIINVNNVKNIRSVKVAGTTLVAFNDYDFDLDFLDSNIKCKITFNEELSGSIEVVYDKGSDKIFADFPREDLSISSFPRMSAMIFNSPSIPGAVGGVTRSNINFSITAFGTRKDELREWLTDIRKKVNDNKNDFVNFGLVVRPTLVGPINVNDRGKDKIFQHSTDFVGEFVYENN